MTAQIKTTIEEVVLRKPRKLDKKIDSFFQSQDEINIYLNGSKTAIWINASGEVEVYENGGADLVASFDILKLTDVLKKEKELTSTF